MKIKYNAPTTLTFCFFSALVLGLDYFVLHGLTRALFTAPGYASFTLTSPLDYLRLATHIAGHAEWPHLIANLSYILLLGPMLEETYGSITMLLMILVTGFVTGVLNACFFPLPLLGASGVVFMMILLASFTNNGRNEVPLTFILIVLLYLGKEFFAVIRADDISQFAHLAGGLCGSLFGFFRPSISKSRRSTARTFERSDVNDCSSTPTIGGLTPVPRIIQASPAKNIQKQAHDLINHHATKKAAGSSKTPNANKKPARKG